MKRITSIILLVAVFLTITQSIILAEQSNIEYYNIYKSIRIKGETEFVSNKFVTAILKNQKGVLNIAEIEIDSSGRYDYTFNNASITDDTELILKCGDEDITSTVYEALLQMSTIAEVSYETIEAENEYRITADLSELVLMTDEFTVIASQYDNDGRLVGCDIFKSTDLEEITTFDKIIDKKGILKLFVWESVSEALPVAKTIQEGGRLILRFGMLADKQQREGFVPITGSNNYERYVNARAELPEEMNIIKPQKPGFKRIFYVSKNGSGNGDISSPFGTLKEALSAYSDLSDEEKREWTAIYIMGGTYEIDEQIAITDDLAGELGSARLFIGAYNGENVVFQNTKTVNGDKIIKVSNENTSEEVIGRINSDVDELYYIDYADLGIEKMSGYEYGTSGKKPVLTYNGSNCTVSRYPNGGDTYIEKVLDEGYDENENYTENVEFIPLDKRPFTWHPSNEIGISGQLCVTWYYNHMQASFDYENGTVKTPSKQTVSQGNKCAVNLVNHPQDRAHFYYYNVFEEIDMRGEWCSSDAEQRIYIYPENKVISSDDEIKILGNLTGSAVIISNVSDIIIDGIKFHTLNGGVDFVNCERAVVQNCEFDNIANTCLNFSKCKSSGTVGTDFRNSYAGVNISGDRAEIFNLSPLRNFVQNCYFNTIGGTCINIGESNGNIVSHNLAENYNGSFIGLFGGNENIIEYNETYAGGFNGNEANIIYVDGQFTSRHNHIRYNYIHDVSPDAKEILLGTGIVFDDLSENNYAYGNVLKNMGECITANGGDNHIMDENVIIDSLGSVTVSDKMYGNENLFGKSVLDNLSGGRFTEKYYKYSLGDNSAWINRYPYAMDRIAYLENASKTWNSGDHSSDAMKFAMAPTGNYILNNTVVNSTEVSIGPYFTQFNLNIKPSIEEVKQFEGNDYNVFYNNITKDSAEGIYDDIISKAGLKREQSYYDSKKIDVIYPESSNAYFAGNTMDICWNEQDNANFYKIIVATDADFNNIVNSKWLIDNRHLQIVQTYPLKESTYYYKVEAFNFGENEEPFAVSETRSVTFAPYEQTEDVTVISLDKANMANSWRSAAGTQYVRSILKTTEPQQMNDDGAYVRFTAPANTTNFRAIWGTGAYSSTEKFNAAYDPKTAMSMEMQIRFPSEENFANYADVPAPHLSPCGTAADKELGSHGKMLYFRIQKSDEKYIVYKGVTGNSNQRTKIGEYTADGLFNRWITIKEDIDMETGIATGSFDGIEITADLNYTDWERNYNWNSENYLRFFDFALNNNSDNDFILDVKDVSVIRKVK